MTPTHWQVSGDRFEIQVGPHRIGCRPPGGLEVRSAGLHLLGVLEVESVDAQPGGAVTLAAGGSTPDVVLRQDTLIAGFPPTRQLAVETQACWRVQPAGVFDLQISTLTPGRWESLSVGTLSRLPAGQIVLLGEGELKILLFRPETGDQSYAEFCHPRDGVGGIDVTRGTSGLEVRFRLFGQELEKGVILRGRLRGLLLAREDDEAAAREAYRRFVREPPPLSA